MAANPPFLACGAVGGALAVAAGFGALVEPTAGLTFTLETTFGFTVFADVGPRAVPLYADGAAWPGFVGAFVGCPVRGAAIFESVLTVFGFAPGSLSSAFLFSVGAPGVAADFAALTAVVGFGFGTGEEDAGGLEAGDCCVFATGPSLPTDASSAAN